MPRPEICQFDIIRPTIALLELADDVRRSTKILHALKHRNANPRESKWTIPPVEEQASLFVLAWRFGMVPGRKGGKFISDGRSLLL